MATAFLQPEGDENTVLYFPAEGLAPRLFLEFLAQHKFLHWLTNWLQQEDVMQEPYFKVTVSNEYSVFLQQVLQYINDNS